MANERPTGYIPAARPELADLIAGNFKEAEQKDLSGRYAVITGASRGIGAALAYQAAQRGIDGLILTSTPSSHDELLAVAQDIHSKFGTDILRAEGDVANPQHADEIYLLAVGAFGDKPALVINNAGVTGDGKLHEHTAESWMAPINVKVKGSFNVIRPFVKNWVARAEAAREKKKMGEFETPGTIVLVGSIVTKVVEDPDAAGSYILKGNSDQTGYTAANAALLGLGQALRREHRTTKALKVVTVLPGYVNTRMTENVNPAFKKMALRAMEGTDLDPMEAAHEILSAAIYAQNGAVVEAVK